MPFRMLEYYLLLKQRYKNKPIKQMVLFVDDSKPNTEITIKTVVEELMKLSDKERADYIVKLLIALDYRLKLKLKG